MAEPFSLGALGALAATEGIRFLYSQAAEVMKRWRDKEAGKDAEAATPVPVPEVEAKAVLAEAPRSPTVDFEALERLHAEIPPLAGFLGNYANGFSEPDPADRELMEAADRLRRALEVVYGQRITFKGEQLDSAGVVVVGRAEAGKVAGDLAGARVQLVRSGRIDGTAKVVKVTEKGRVTGVDAGPVG